MRRLELFEIKKRECEILDFIDDICKKNNIQYFLSAGTAIGAVRHKGFIPWDDDIDIFMTRENYQKFLNITLKNKHYRFVTLSLQSEKTYYYPFIKVVDNETTLDEILFKKINGMGVWVDIFPLDYYDDKSNYKNIAHRLNRKNLLSRYSHFEKTNGFFRNIIKFILYFFYFKYKNPRKYAEKLEKLALSCHKTEMLTIYNTPVCSEYKDVYPVSWFSETIMCDFENKKYPISKDYDKILTKRYGEYMKLPSLEEQKSNHEIRAYLK